MKFNWLFFPLAFLFSITLSAQKKPIDHSVYDGWQSLKNFKLSNDGKWASYQVEVQEGDSKLYLYPLDTSVVLQFARAEQMEFTNDSKFGVFKVKPFYKDIKAVKDKKLKKDSLKKDSLMIVNLLNRKVEKIEKVKSFQIPEKGGSVLAYLTDSSKGNEPEKKDDEDKEDDNDANFKTDNFSFTAFRFWKKV